MEGIVISFVYLLLHLAVIVFVAFVLQWLVTSDQVMGLKLDPNILKWGRIIVILLCVIAVMLWLGSVLGYGPGLPYGSYRLR